MTCVRLYGMRDIEFSPLPNSLQGTIFSSEIIPQDLLGEILGKLDVFSKCQVSLTSKVFRCTIISLGDNVNLLNFAVRLTDILIAAGIHNDESQHDTGLSSKDISEEIRLDLMQEWVNALNNKSPIRKNLLDKSFDILIQKWPKAKFKPFFASLGYSVFKDNDYSGWEKYFCKDALDDLAENYNKTKEFEKSTFYYEVSAKAGYKHSQLLTAYHYEMGIGVEVDHIKSIHYYSLAANRGSADAISRLAKKFRLGEGVDKDDEIASKFYLRAADKGHLISQYNTGVCYLRGLGVAKNLDMAIKYFTLASNQNYSEAKQWLEKCLKKKEEESLNLSFF